MTISSGPGVTYVLFGCKLNWEEFYTFKSQPGMNKLDHTHVEVAALSKELSDAVDGLVNRRV